MRTAWMATGVGVFLALAGITSEVRAQDAEATEVSEEARTQARAIFGEGNAALEGGDCQTAVTKFRQAFEMVHEPSILYNLATAESECHDIVPAVEHYDAFLAQVRTGRAARYRADARRQVTTLRRQLAHLDLEIAGLEQTDEVLVDQRAVATTAIDDIPVAAGDHMIVVRRTSAEWARQSATVTAGQHLTVSVTLTEPQAVATPEEAATTVATEESDTNPLTQPSPNRRRRRIIIGSSVAGAVVIGVIVGVVVATH